jgi:hypothetical protein
MQDDHSHRRHAIQVVAALPDDTEDALLVLDLARQLVSGFLSGNQPAEPALDRDRGRVLSISSSSSGRNR